MTSSPTAGIPVFVRGNAGSGPRRQVLWKAHRHAVNESAFPRVAAVIEHRSPKPSRASRKLKPARRSLAARGQLITGHLGGAVPRFSTGRLRSSASCRNANTHQPMTPFRRCRPGTAGALTLPDRRSPDDEQAVTIRVRSRAVRYPRRRKTRWSFQANEPSTLSLSNTQKRYIPRREPPDNHHLRTGL